MYSQQQYIKEIAPELKKVLRRENLNSLPKLKKITINAGVGSQSANNKKFVNEVVANITLISGQKPVIRLAKKSISNFKLREGMPVGVSVSLRGQSMYDFFGKLIDVVFPRIRDFRGFNLKSFDGNGNFSVGFNEHTVFPEINPDDIVQTHGVQVTIETTATNNQEAIELFNLYKFPFKDQIENKK
jgi:large subunit ribosomal protein L5